MTPDRDTTGRIKAFHQALVDAQSSLAAGDRKQAVEILAATINRLGLVADLANDAGNLLAACEQFEQATRCYRLAIDSGHSRAQALNNLGNVLVFTGKPAEAVDCFRAALADNGGDPETLANLAAAYDACGDFEAAEDLHHQALEIRPDHPKFNLNYALHLLRAGRIAEAIPHYRYRFQSPAWGSELGALDRIDLPTPGDQFEAGTVVVGEQGLGDEIYLLARMPEPAQTTEWTYVGEPRLEALFKRSFVNARFVPRTAGNVNLLLARAANVWRLDHVLLYAANLPEPAAISALKADPDSVDGWRKALSVQGDRPCIGISWTGGKRRVDRTRREAPPGYWSALDDLDCTFIDIQYDNRPEERQALAGTLGCEVVRLEGFDLVNRFDHSLGLLAALDHVVLVDNSSAHLAGAMGLGAELLLSHVCDWRWGARGSRSDAYPGLRLHRQPRPADWGGVFTATRESLLKEIRTA